MKIEEEELFIKAEKKVRSIRNFYLHLILYIIGVLLISYNFYIIEGPYTSIITGLNITILVFWTLIICIHGWNVFKAKFLFKKSWEDKKIEEYLDENQQQRWE
jgi:uncharacterized membrane protein